MGELSLAGIVVLDDLCYLSTSTVSVWIFCRPLLGYYAEGMHTHFKENLI